MGGIPPIRGEISSLHYTSVFQFHGFFTNKRDNFNCSCSLSEDESTFSNAYVWMFHTIFSNLTTSLRPSALSKYQMALWVDDHLQCHTHTSMRCFDQKKWFILRSIALQCSKFKDFLKNKCDSLNCSCALSDNESAFSSACKILKHEFSKSNLARSLHHIHIIRPKWENVLYVERAVQ